MTIKLIAANAVPTGAKCHFGYKRLTPVNSFGYTSHKSTAKKAVAGCASPKARGQEPQHRTGMRLFCSRPSFGGPNGRALALPVTLRVPRSCTPVRAAAQCASWSAVVHLAQLETNMSNVIAHPNAAACQIIQPRWRGRFPKYVASLNIARREKSISEHKQRMLQEEIAQTLAASEEWHRIGHGLRCKALQLQQDLRLTRS